MGWSESDLCGPEGEDWRVPVSELEFRQSMLAKALDNAGLEGALCIILWIYIIFVEVDKMVQCIFLRE